MEHMYSLTIPTTVFIDCIQNVQIIQIVEIGGADGSFLTYSLVRLKPEVDEIINFLLIMGFADMG